MHRVTNTQKELLLFFVLAAGCMAVEPQRDEPDVKEVVPKPVIESAPAQTGKENSPESMLLERARESSANLYSDLQSFVCNEVMERYRSAANGSDSQQIDTLQTKVSFENGVEQYEEIYQDKRKRPSISSITGAWSEGEFGTLLKQTEMLLNSRPVAFREYQQVDGSEAAVYEVEVSEEVSPWELEIEQHHYRVPFRTRIWVAKENGEILKLERISGALNKIGIAEIRWGVILGSVTLNGRTWLLPRSGDYSVLYQKSKRREWNVMSFADYHRYGAEAELRF